MAIVHADDLAESAPAPRRPGRLSSLVAPLTGAAVAAAIALLQGWVLAVWGARDGLGIRDVLIKWDAGWMTKIAEFGYSGFSVSPDPTERVEWQSVAFFPGYPVLTRIVAAPLSVFGQDDAIFVGGLVVSAAASLVFAWGLARLAADLWQTAGLPTPSPRVRVALAAAAAVLAFGAPMGFIYWMPYSEALFSALSVWTLVMVLRRRYLVAGLLTLAAGLTRITAMALVLMLCVAAAVELWQWSRRRSRFPVAALVAPVLGYAGLAAYVRWADDQVADIGGYFAAQRRGWNSGFDFGMGSLRWLGEHLLMDDVTDHDAVAYVLSSWVMIAVAVLCAASLWSLVRGWIPWQVWLTAVLVAGSVLGSDGIMHARPRLLLLPVLLLLLPFVVRAVRWAADGRRGLRAAVLVTTGVLWCALGVWFTGWMLIEFQYGI